MKFYFEIPIPIECNLKCPYCFHVAKWDLEKEGPDKVKEKYEEKRVFTTEQLNNWIAKHLPDVTEALVELSGGEMSHPKCQDVSLDYIDNLKGPVKFQLQTNGLGDEKFYKETIKRKDKIDRIGFTFHRKTLDKIGNNEGEKVKEEKIKKFKETVNLFKKAGFKIYVKEILFPYLKAQILENKKYWEGEGVEFRMQDFKPLNGRDRTPYYTPEEMALVHPEYCHGGSECACRVGYKNVIVRGYDYFAGDVIGCWQNPKPIGSIVDDWYDPNYTVNILTTGELKVNAPNLDKNHISSATELPNVKIQTLSGNDDVKQKLITRLDKYKLEFQQLDARITEYKQQIQVLTEQGHAMIGAIKSTQELLEELGGV